MQEITDLDKKILRLLQEDATRSSAEIGAEIGASSAAVWRRIERLESIGVIEGYELDIDPRALGYEVEVSLRVSLEKTQPNAFDSFIAAARTVAEINEIQTFLGRVDVRLNVLARDMAHYQEIYRQDILALPHIADIEALMLVSNVYDADRLPL